MATVRPAIGKDIATLVDLMADFYAEAGFALDRPQASAAFDALLADPRLGAAWLVEDEGQAVGHLVLTFRFAMEYGGPIACVDDLYIAPSHRRRGLAAATLRVALDWCRAGDVRAITVEAGVYNLPALALYRGLGMDEAEDRRLLALAVEAPCHRR